MTPDSYQDRFVSAGDGLKLFARDYGAEHRALPVVCLPGLSRNSHDFHRLALALSTAPERPRRVVCLDYRGRGRSEHDRDWRNYDVKVETADVLAVLTVLGIEEAVLVGTSRGGLITMALSAARPALLRGAVLNDVGPVIEGKGLARIRAYVGKLPRPRDLDEGADILRRLSDAHFPAWTEEDWRDQARGTWEEREGGLVLAYDPALAKTLESVDLEQPLPALWPLFQGLTRVTTLVIRGATSDILSASTVEEMRRRHPRLEVETVPGQGHVPALAAGLVERIAAFVASVERVPAGALTA